MVMMLNASSGACFNRLRKGVNLLQYLHTVFVRSIFELFALFSYAACLYTYIWLLALWNIKIKTLHTMISTADKKSATNSISRGMPFHETRCTIHGALSSSFCIRQFFIFTMLAITTNWKMIQSYASLFLCSYVFIVEHAEAKNM